MFPTFNFLSFPSLKHIDLVKEQSNPVLQDYFDPKASKSFPKTLYRLSWAKLDAAFLNTIEKHRITPSQILPGTPLPEKYNTWVDNFVLNITEDAKKEVQRLTFCAVSEEAHRSDFYKNKHYLGDALSRPQYAYIQAAFKILADCMYDVKERFYYREDDKYTAPYAMLVRFWFSQELSNRILPSSDEILERSDIKTLIEKIALRKRLTFDEYENVRVSKIGSDFVEGVTKHIESIRVSELSEMRHNMKEVGKCSDCIPKEVVQERGNLSQTIRFESDPYERGFKENKWVQEEIQESSPGVSVSETMKLGVRSFSKRHPGVVDMSLKDLIGDRNQDPHVVPKDGQRIPTEFNTVLDNNNEAACKEAIDQSDIEVYKNLASAQNGNKEFVGGTTTSYLDDALSVLSEGSEESFDDLELGRSVWSSTKEDPDQSLDFVWGKEPSLEDVDKLFKERNCKSRKSKSK